MAVCELCGKNYGMLGGGEEPFTGSKLLICSNCTTYFREIEKTKHFDKEKCEKICVELKNRCKTEKVADIVNDYMNQTMYYASHKIEIDRDRQKKEEELKRTIEEQKEKERVEAQIKKQEVEKRKEMMKITTGYNFDGYKITEYIDVVHGVMMTGTGMLSELDAQLSDLFGTEVTGYELKIAKAKIIAQDRLKFVAAEKGANAIVGIDFDIFTFAHNVISVSANGTAVVIEKI